MSLSTTALRLEHVRKNKGVSLEQISSLTKIGTAFLLAIETEHFEKLPGGVFSASFVRQYAAAIGFPEGELLDQLAAFERSRSEGESEQQAQCEARRGWTFRCVNWLRTFPAARPEY